MIEQNRVKTENKLKQQSQQLKLEKLQRDLDLGIASADRGELFDADEVFKELLQGLPYGKNLRK
ncbi:MAG: hypothetical protein HQL70_01200 [Magnetococcales bacterium]|nr:hypothetical protein [Magnetococcales bacterium]